MVNDVLTNTFEMAQADAYRRQGGWGENFEYDPDPEKPFDPANTRFTPFLDARMKTKGMLDILPAETERLRAQHLADAIPAESFAAGANEVATLENVNEEDFIGENRDWPLYEGEDGEGTRTNLWNHSAFREVAFYHTSKFYTSLAATGKPRVIIDTDLGGCKDDLFAIDLAARMHKQGKLDLMAVMMNRPDRSDKEKKGEFLTFADRYLASLELGDLPIGTSETPSSSWSETTEPQKVFNPYWTLIYSNNVTGVGLLMPTNRTPDQIGSLTNAVALYRQLLKGAPDQSVVICSIGFLNNLKALMESATDYEGDGSINSTGLQLIAAKVKELRIMGGSFDPSALPDGKGGAEYNFAGDPAAARMVMEEWPSPIVCSPWEVGRNLDYEHNWVVADFPAGTFNPVIRAAEEVWPPIKGGDELANCLWDPMTVLPLIEGGTLVPLSSNGVITVDEKTGKTTFEPDASSNRCYQVASNMNARAVMNRLRSIYKTGNPSVSVVPISPPEPGIDYNGSVLSVEFYDANLGRYSIEDLCASLTIAGGVYEPDEGSVHYDELGGVLTFTITVPPEKVKAGNAYEGEVKVGFRNDTLGENVVYARKRPFVQGRHAQAEPMTDWFNVTNLEAPTNYVPATRMPVQCLAKVETTFLFEAPSEATDDPPVESVDWIQGAVRIVKDGADGYKFQYYACVGKTNEDSVVRGWWDANYTGEGAEEIKPKIGTNYTVFVEADYFDDNRGGENTLIVSVEEVGSNQGPKTQFIGNIINARGGRGGTPRLNSVEFVGDGEIASLVGNYYTNVVNATLAKIDGDREYATVAEAVAAAMGSPVRLMHAASWKPTVENLDNSVRFLNKGDLHLDLSELPLGTRAVWTDVDGNDGTLTLVAGLPVGVCSWTWHSSMTNVLAQMKVDGRYNGMQLALAPWLGIDNTGTYFGDQEGTEVWDFIKQKIASGELNVMSTMINFPKEDYTTLSSITNTQGYMYGVREEWPDADEQWASNLFYTAEAARLTAELGVKTLTTESGFICINENLMYDRVSNICEICKSYGVDFLIESGPQHSQYMTNLLTRLNAAGFDNVGVNFDPGDTALFGPEDPVESYKVMQPWIRMIHAKDCKANRSAWNEDCVWGDGIVSGLDFGGSHTFLNAVKEDFTNDVNILYERLSGDATLTVKRQGEITLAVDRILAALTEPEGTAGNPWAVGAPGNVVFAYTNGTMLVVEGRGAMKDFGSVAEGTAERSETVEGRDSTGCAPWGTDIAAVDFGAQVTNVGANAFAGCAALTTLTMRGNPPALGGNDLSGVTTIVIREDARAKFEADPDWNAYAAKFESMPVCYDYEHIKTLAPFLHEVWFDDYTFDEKCETLAGVEMFSCSSVRNGNFIGRNFDFFLDDKPEFVVHVAANPAKGRLASVAMAMHTGMREDGVTNGQYTASYDLLPNRTLDGINECGVAINQNVVAYDPEVVAGAGKEFTGTNPGAPDLNISFVTRMVLDRATNAAHAVELIKSRNLFGMSVSGDILHYMISDKDETYVVEIITNTVVARRFTMMTNFAINWDNENARALTDADNEVWTRNYYMEPSNLVASAGNFVDATNALAKYYARHAEGVERFVRLRDNYAEGATFEGMEALMRRAQYSQASTFDTQPYWYSDRCSVEVDKKLTAAGYPAAANTYMLYGLKYYKDDADPDNLLDGSLDEFLNREVMEYERECLAHKDDHRKDDCGVWLTVHNTTYDISNRMFRVVVQEDYDHTFDIYLSDEPAEQPVTPGEPLGPYKTAEKAANVANKAVLVPSAEVEAKLDDGSGALGTYCDMFSFNVTGGDGAWFVEAFLKPEDWTNVVESAQAATLQIPIAAIAALGLGDDPIPVPLTNCVPGFYYSLYEGSAVTNIRAAMIEEDLNILCGTKKEVVIPRVAKPSDKAGFFFIGVLETPTVYFAGENSSPTGIPPYLPGHPPVRH